MDNNQTQAPTQADPWDAAVQNSGQPPAAAASTGQDPWDAAVQNQGRPPATPAVPVSTASPNAVATGGAGVSDPATAQAMGANPDTTGGVIDTAKDIWGAAKHFVQNIPGVTQNPVDTVKGIWHALPPVELADQTKKMLPVVNTYEKARASGASIPDAIKAADITARAQDSTAQTVQAAADAYKKNPTRETVRALGDATALAASFFVPGVAEDVVGAGAGAVEGAEGAEAVEGADAATTTPAETPAAESNPIEAAQNKAVSKIADKANVPEGTAATEEVPEVTNEDQAPTVESKQPEIHQDIRDSANSIAEREGFTAPSAKTPISEVMSKGIGDQFYARAKAGYAAIEDAVPGTNLEELDTTIRELPKQIRMAAGDTEKVADLTEQLKGAQSDRLAAANKIEEAGLDPDQPSRDWRGYKSAYDFQNKILTPSTKGIPGVGNGEVVDPNGMATRLRNQSVSKTATQPGRVQQLMGKDVADTLRNNIEQHASDIKNFEPTVTPAQAAVPATDQQALKELIQPKAGKLWGTNNDYGKALDDFNKLGTEGQKARFTNPTAVGKALREAATKQNILTGLKATLGLGSLGAVEETIRRIFF